MLTVSNELKNAFMKLERTIYVRIKIGNRTFDNDNVVSVEYDSGSLSGEVFAIGSTYSNSIKITFSELVEGLKELDEVSYEIGIKLSSGAIEYVPMGIFIINDAIGMDRNNNKTTIECMDKMVMMGGTYVSSLTYPAAIREVALEVANKAGIAVDSTSFARLSADKIAKPEGYTYREAIGLIAQFEAGFATFNRYGKLEIRTLSDPNFAIPPDNYFSKGLVKNEVFFRLGGISCVTDYSDATIQSGNTTGNQVVLENRIMTKMLLDKIYQKIQTINYYPFSLNWQGNPVLEAGDWVVVEDLQGNKFKTLNLNYSLSFSGGLTAKSSAETATQSDVTYGYKSQLQQKIEWIYAQIDAAGGNLIFEGIDEPSNPKEGDLWFKIIGPDKQILIFKKKADGTLFWEPQISTADINKVAEEVNKIIDQADKDRTKAEQEINQALTDAKNYTEVKAQEFNNQLLIVNQNVLTATNSANAAVLKADKAIEDVGFLKPDVATAKANAVTAIQDATTATKNATTAIQNAQTALNSVATLSQEVDVSITNINGELTRKVSQTTFNTLSGTVGTHTTQISQTQTALLAKAESSLVNTIKGTVDSHTTQIKVVSDGLELKAETSLVNTVKGTVDSHTTQINANSQAITARLTSVQIETLLTGKQYVNQTTLNATSNGLTAQITQVSNELSNLEIGGRNYARGFTALMYTTNGSFNSDGSVTLVSSTGNGIGTGVVPKIGAFVKCDGGTYTISYKTQSGTSRRVLIYVKDSSGNSVTTGVTGYTYHSGYGAWYSDSSVSTGKTFLIPSNVDSIAVGFQVAVPTGVTDIIYWSKLEKSSKASDWSPAIEDMTTLEKVVTIEANIQGIQTTVANKAEQSQVTQLAGQISTKVESAAYNSKMTQLDSAINLRVVQSDVTAAILADSKIKDTRNDNQLPSWYYANYGRRTIEEFKNRTVMGVSGGAVYGQLTTKVLWDDASGGSITQIFSSGDGVFQRVSTSSAAWGVWDKIAEAGQLISQINLSTEGILLQGKRIQLDGDVTMTAAFVTDIKTKSLEAVYADIATLKTRVLTADVITSAMIKSDLSLIDKLFATDANVQRLTAKTAFINSVKAIDIAADRITAGTLNAAKVNIVNLDASRITTGVLNGISITSSFNYIYEGTTRNVGTTTIQNGEYSSYGTFTNSFGRTYMYINPDTIYAENIKSDNTVRSMYKLSGKGLEVNILGDTASYTQDGIYFEAGGQASVKYHKGNARIEVGSYNGVGLGTNVNGSYENRLTVGGATGGTVGPFVDIYSPLTVRSGMNMNSTELKNALTISGTENILFRNSTNRIVQGTDGILNILSPVQISLGSTNGTTSSTSLVITGGTVSLNKPLQLNGNHLNGASNINGATNINGAQNILFNGSSNRIVQGTDGFLNILSPFQLSLGWTDGSSTFTTMIITRNQIVAKKNLNMDGNSISNQSDRRLKKNIVNSNESSLEAISRWRFVNYEWIDVGKPKGVKLGLIAQDTPELTMYDAENDIYNIDSSKQIMMNSHAIQQINKRVTSIENVTNVSSTLASRAFSEMQQLKNKVTELELKIKKLESVA